MSHKGFTMFCTPKKYEILGTVLAIGMFIGLWIVLDLSQCERLGHSIICGEYKP